MSKHTPPPIHDVAAEFDGLPGVGPRAALRYAYWLVSQPKERIIRFSEAIRKLAEQITRCNVCGLWSSTSPCIICANPKRDQSKVCVVAHPQDVRILEDSGVYNGLYHVLSGTIDPISGRTPESLNFPTLYKRLQPPVSQIKEIVLAFDPDVPGDTTALYLRKQISDQFGEQVRITRLARGLPNGAQLEYADEMTVAEALENRK
ncbi:recombination protein RecR [Candidatus Uhrbacteria bacterium]|nr:recombination protein RecR [Candidatus Uhrbacteria bacterium]MBD3284563.1 recombination protein RecR [Candidatus Uhrbacteria bacterium]